MYSVHVDIEHRIREVGVCQSCGIREVEVDDEHCKEGEYRVKAQVTEANVRVPRSDDPIRVTVPEQDMLLKDSLQPKCQYSGSRKDVKCLFMRT